MPYILDVVMTAITQFYRICHSLARNCMRNSGLQIRGGTGYFSIDFLEFKLKGD